MLELHAFQIRDFIDDGEVSVVWCPGDDCIADIYTKSVDATKFRKFSKLLLGDAPQETKTALVTNSFRNTKYTIKNRVLHCGNGDAICLGGVCVGGVDSKAAWPTPGESRTASRRAPGEKGRLQRSHLKSSSTQQA